MVDNIAVTAGSGTIIGADDIGGGVLAQRVKPVWGPDGTGNDTDVATGKPLPIQLRGSDGTDRSNLLPISVADGGDVTVGARADAKSAATDTTAITAMQVWKQISASVQALVAPGLSANVTVTRPSDTTAYTALDVLGPTGGGTSGIDFNLAAVSGSNIMITGVALERDVAALISGEAAYSLYLYNVTPPSALADNSPFDLSAGDRASFLGKINIPTPVDEVSTLYIEVNGINKQVKLSGTHIFAYLVTVGAYTPASATVLKITLNAVQL